MNGALSMKLSMKISNTKIPTLILNPRHNCENPMFISLADQMLNKPV